MKKFITGANLSIFGYEKKNRLTNERFYRTSYAVSFFFSDGTQEFSVIDQDEATTPMLICSKSKDVAEVMLANSKNFKNCYNANAVDYNVTVFINATDISGGTPDQFYKVFSFSK